MNNRYYPDDAYHQPQKIETQTTKPSFDMQNLLKLLLSGKMSTTDLLTSFTSQNPQMASIMSLLNKMPKTDKKKPHQNNDEEYILVSEYYDK